MSYNKETGVYEGYIYKITNKINGKVYIGQTRRTIEFRWKQHVKDSKKLDYSLYRSMRKYGVDNFIISQLEFIELKDKYELCKLLDEREIYWVSVFNSYGENGYNMTIGGQDNAPNKFLEKGIIQYSINGIEERRYLSISEGGEITGFSMSDIIACCKKTKIRRVQNKVFRYDDDPLSKDEIEMLKIKYPTIYQFSVKGELLNSFEFIKDAVDYLIKCGINAIYSNISACCNGNVLTSSGFVWRKYPDCFDTYKTPKIKNIIEQRDRTTGDLISTFKSTHEVIEEYPLIDKSSLINCLNGINITTYGYIWNYEGNFSSCSNRIIRNKKIDVYTKHGKYIKTFENSNEAISFVKDSAKNSNEIRSCCRGEKKSAYGYVWRYYNDPFDKYDVDFKHNANTKNIYCYLNNGELINVFIGAKEASKNTGVSVESIRRNCRGIVNTTRSDFIFSYEQLTVDEIKNKIINK